MPEQSTVVSLLLTSQLPIASHDPRARFHCGSHLGRERAVALFDLLMTKVRSTGRQTAPRLDLVWAGPMDDPVADGASSLQHVDCRTL